MGAHPQRALGPLVPLTSNSPKQWIASSGMILRARIGSEVQGMSTGGSDIDEMGVCIEPHQTVIGHSRFEHYTYRTQPDGVTSGPGDLDLTIYSCVSSCTWSRPETQRC